jgi:hypothetical protein
MKTIIRGGILLGILVTIWTYIFGMTGMHRSLAGAMLFPIIATVIELAVLFWALRRTAAEGRGWFGQVSAGTLLAFVGGCLILATSYLYVTQVHPTYLAEVREAGIAAMRSAGMDEATIQQQQAAQEKFSTPMAQAVFGFLGTVISGFILSATLGIFLRSKAPRTVTAPA